MPSPAAYPFQWFWDSCFHAIVWARFDPERAAEELRGLLAWQGPDGFIPHVDLLEPATVARRNAELLALPRDAEPVAPAGRSHDDARMQPPVLAQAVERVVDACGGDAFLRETIAPLERYYRYLARARDPDGDSLLTIISSFESGLDHCPSTTTRSLHVDDADPLGRSSCDALARVREQALRLTARAALPRAPHHARGRPLHAHLRAGPARRSHGSRRAAGDDALARWARDTAGRVTDALIERELRRPGGPLLEPRRHARAADPRQDDRLADAADPRGSAARGRRVASSSTSPIPASSGSTIRSPSTARRSRASCRDPVSRTRLIWRGPMSMNTNWFLAHGLRAHGYPDLADAIADRSRELVERHGFNEFYNPLHGRAGRRRDVRLGDARRRHVNFSTRGLTPSQQLCHDCALPHGKEP